MKIRFALEKDIDSICSMYRDHFKEISILSPDNFTEADQESEFITETITDKLDQLIVVEADNELCAFAVLIYESTPPYNCFIPRKYLCLCDIYVKPSHRRLGIATNLLEEIKAYGKKIKVDYIELSVLSNNVSAVQLYDKNGWKEHMHILHYTINGNS